MAPSIRNHFTPLLPSAITASWLPKVGLLGPTLLNTASAFGELATARSSMSAIVNAQMGSLLDPFQSFITGWFDQLYAELGLPDITKRILEALDARIIPDNLNELGIGEKDIDDIAEVLHAGIPLFWVPRARIARRLIDAPTFVARRAVVGHELPAIVVDCTEALDLVSNSSYLYEADRLREAADLLFTHPAAAQSLATATLDSLMYRIARSKPAVYTLVASPAGRGKSGHEEDARERLKQDIGPRGSLVLAPVRQIYPQYQPRSGAGEIPRTFNKHASFHRVHPFQYSKRNAAIALMMGTSVLFYMSRWFDSDLEQSKHRPPGERSQP